MLFLYHLHFVFVISCPALVASGTCSKDLAILSEVLKYTGDLLEEAIHVTRDHPGPKDCAQIMKEGRTKSGIYRIWPLNWQKVGSLQVYCDMDTESGGWTVIQRRDQHGNPEDYFYQTWAQYKAGFGSLDKEFWLGNDMIFAITNQGNYTLRIDLKDKECEERFETFKEFWIESEDRLYKFHVAGYSGNAGNSVSYMDNAPFSTKDRENDKSPHNCAKLYKGGWWYVNCHDANLNGLNLNGENRKPSAGITYDTWKGKHYSLSKVEIKVRPSNYAE